MMNTNELVRDGNTVWVPGDMLPFASERLERAIHRFVCSGHDKLVVDFRECPTVSEEQVGAASTLAATALRHRVHVMFIASPAVGRRLRRFGLNALVTLLTVGLDWRSGLPQADLVAAD